MGENGFFWVVWLGREIGGDFGEAQEFSSWAHHLGWFYFLSNLGKNVQGRGGLMGNYSSTPILSHLYMTFFFFFFLNYYLFLILTTFKKKIKLLIFLMRINLYKLHFLSSSHFSFQPNKNFFFHQFTFPSNFFIFYYLPNFPSCHYLLSPSQRKL